MLQSNPSSSSVYCLYESIGRICESPEFSINLTVFNHLSANREVQEVLETLRISVSRYMKFKKGRSFMRRRFWKHRKNWNLVKYTEEVRA